MQAYIRTHPHTHPHTSAHICTQTHTHIHSVKSHTKMSTCTNDVLIIPMGLIAFDPDNKHVSIFTLLFYVYLRRCIYWPLGFQLFNLSFIHLFFTFWFLIWTFLVEHTTFVHKNALSTVLTTSKHFDLFAFKKKQIFFVLSNSNSDI